MLPVTFSVNGLKIIWRQENERFKTKKIPTLFYVELSYLYLSPQRQGNWEMYLDSSVPTMKIGDLVNMQLSLPQRMQVTYGLKNDLSQAYSLRAKMNNFNKTKRIVKTEVYKDYKVICGHSLHWFS